MAAASQVTGFDKGLPPDAPLMTLIPSRIFEVSRKYIHHKNYNIKEILLRLFFWMLQTWHDTWNSHAGVQCRSWYSRPFFHRYQKQPKITITTNTIRHTGSSPIKVGTEGEGVRLALGMYRPNMLWVGLVCFPRTTNTKSLREKLADTL